MRAVVPNWLELRRCCSCWRGAGLAETVVLLLPAAEDMAPMLKYEEGRLLCSDGLELLTDDVARLAFETMLPSLRLRIWSCVSCW